ncbi:cytosolic 5'-nucleotidase 3-like [Watersipora subatra]|uniref:cytosolic 5'-nucleotidase 3-like n=1 Tax=Watersipora subatra TaxID=2589382 RepID=UPI00355B7538
MSSRLPYSARLLTLALASGIGIASIYLMYRYWRRKKTVAEDIVDEATEGVTNDGDRVANLKRKLKKLLYRQNVHCTDIDDVEELIDELIIDGPSKLQVIADFDRTMTPISYRGKPVPSTHGVIESCPHLPDWFKEEVDKTRIYYQKIEFSPVMSREEKIPFMEEWWHKAQERLTRCSLSREDLKEGVRSSNLYLREKLSAVLDKLHVNDIPMLVFSAGVGNVIEQMFLQRYSLYDNIHIIANWMDFNHEGVLVGFKGETIHTFNKNTHAVHNASYFKSLRHRHNVILLGDSLGDLDIAHGLSKTDRLLTIGYLNEQVDASLEEYKRRFDIVLVHEEGAELLQALIENIADTDQ